MLITNISENEQAKKLNKELDYSRDNVEKNQYFLQNMNTPSEINDIQPRATQVWICDEIGLIPMEGGTNLYILTSSFKADKYGR